MFQSTRVTTEPSDAEIVAASEMLAHHPKSCRWNEPGSNPASFQGRMVSQELVCDYEYGESPHTNHWNLRIAVYWQGERVFHASKRTVSRDDAQRGAQSTVHHSEPGQWREALLAFVTASHACCE